MKQLPHLLIPLVVITGVIGAILLAQKNNTSTAYLAGSSTQPTETTPPEESAAPQVAAPESPPTPDETETSTDETFDLNPLLTLVEAGKLEEARALLADIEDTLPAELVAKLRSALGVTPPAQEAVETPEPEPTSVAETEAATPLPEPKVDVATRPEPETQMPEPPAEVVVPEPLELFFASESAYLSTSATAIADEAVSTLVAEPRLSVQLRGHADQRGDPGYNAILSRARAVVVKDQLIKGGVEEDRIEVIPFGESLAEGQDAAVSRRVDIIFRR